LQKSVLDSSLNIISYFLQNCLHIAVLIIYTVASECLANSNLIEIGSFLEQGKEDNRGLPGNGS